MRKLLTVFILLLLLAPSGWADVDTLRTIGNGSSNQWTASAGNKYETVDEDSPNGNTDYIFTEADAQIQDFTVSDIATITSVDSVWIKVNWTWTRSAGPQQDIGSYYDIGAGFVEFDLGQTTKGGTYITDSVKLTTPSVSQVNALQVRTISTGSSGAEQWRTTWWGIVVYGTVAGTPVRKPQVWIIQ